MTAPLQNDDPLAGLFLPPERPGSVPLRYRSGRLTDWDVKTGANTVAVDGVSFVNLPVMPGTYLGILAENDVVSLMSTTDVRGITTYVIIGIALTPPDIRIGRAAQELGVVDDIQAATGGTSSTTYTPTLSAGVTPQVVFRTLTGKALVHWGGYCVNGTIGASAYFSFEVREGNSTGAGTVVLAADDARAIINRGDSAGSDDSQGGWSYLLQGLVPGEYYNAQGMFRASAGNAVFLNRMLIVDPK
jgi:hypothetical protein